VTEFCPGGSLWNLIHNPQKSYPWSSIVDMAKDTAAGLVYLHGHNPPILHRDLKSANLLIDKSGGVKVCDFGLARVKESVNTMTGQVGTYQWMAPEVLANERYTEKADVYSFGIILWEMATRQCPYDGMNAIQAAMAVLRESELPLPLSPYVYLLLFLLLLLLLTRLDPDLRPPVAGAVPAPLNELMVACWDQSDARRPTMREALAMLSAMKL